MIPAEIVYGFIDEMSDRVDRGLRVSEQALRKANESRDFPVLLEQYLRTAGEDVERRYRDERETGE